MSKDVAVPKGVELYDPEDVVGYRQRMFNGVKEEISSLFPYSQNGVRLEASAIDYDRKEDFSPEEEKTARENGRSLNFRLRGKINLVDEQTGQKLDSKELTLAQVPWITPRGTVLLDGREIASSNQARLLPGIYTRRRDSGELESHFNPKAGTSASQFRVILEPSTATYRLQVGSSANLHFYSLMNSLGVPDDELKKAWGPEIFDINSKKVDSGVLERAYKVMVPDWMKTPEDTKESKADMVRKAFDKAKIHRFVAETNLPEMLLNKRASGGIQAPPSPEFYPDLDFHKAASCVWWLYDLDYPSPDFFLDSKSFVRKQASSPGGMPYSWLASYAEGDEGAVNMGWSDTAAELIPKVAAGDPRSAWIMVSYMTDPLNYAADPVKLATDMVNYRESVGGVEKLARDASHRRLEARGLTEQPRSSEQARAGNYRKGKFSFRGLKIVIETAKGQTRKGSDKSGKPWEVLMKDDYGYILRTLSEADDDHIDVFIGPELASDSVYVIDQLDADGNFDEHKCMLGYVSAEKAKKAYERNYSDGRKVKGITHMSFSNFKDWLKATNGKKPASEHEFKKKASNTMPMLAVNEVLGILEDPILSQVWFGEDAVTLEKEANSETIFYHGSPYKFDKLRAGSWVTPYLEDARRFGIPWDTDDFVVGEPGARNGRPPVKLKFKEGNKPAGAPLYVYKIVGSTKPAFTNTGVSYDWNRQVAQDTPVELIEYYKDFNEILDDTKIQVSPEGLSPSMEVGVMLQKQLMADADALQPEHRLREDLGATDLDLEELELILRDRGITAGIEGVKTVADMERLITESSSKVPKEAAEKYPSWVGIDLDGTLAYASPEYSSDKVGDPIPSMMELVSKLREKGKTVKIFTARATNPEHLPVVEAWLEEHGLGGLEVTNVKDPGLRLIIDDRAVGVRRNKGMEMPVIERVIKRALDREFEFLRRKSMSAIREKFEKQGAKWDDESDYVPVGVNGLIAASSRLLAVNRGFADPDERDHLAFKQVITVPDLVRERIRIDEGRRRKKLFTIAARSRSLSNFNVNALGSPIRGQFISNPLSADSEQTNPMLGIEQLRRVTQMGPGGIGSTNAITEDMVSLDASTFGFLSSIEGPESELIGIDTRLASGTRIGSDGRIYQRLRNRNTGRSEYVSPADVMNKSVKIPD